jgi:hypothetical protein
MLETFLRTGKHALLAATLLASCAINGCIESEFTLADSSRLPKSMTLPPGLTRKDVSVELLLLTPLKGPNAKLILGDRKGKKLSEVRGKWAGDAFNFADGSSELIRLVPCTSDMCFGQDGRVVALFYFMDDWAAWWDLTAGRLPLCPKKRGMVMDTKKNRENGGTCLAELGVRKRANPKIGR